MKQTDQTQGGTMSRPLNNYSPEYPDVLVPAESEEPEEDNPTAYALLSEIKDPYYEKTQPKGRTDSFHEGIKPANS